jgi:heme a synthase
VLLACQGLVGLVQYSLKLPAEIVWFHVVLSALTWIALLTATAAAGRLGQPVSPPDRPAEPAARELAASR